MGASLLAVAKSVYYYYDILVLLVVAIWYKVILFIQTLFENF